MSDDASPGTPPPAGAPVPPNTAGAAGANPYAATPSDALQPIPSPQHGGPGGNGDGTGGVIPYKNPHALIAYYLGIFSLFPIFGFFLAVPAFILGIIGLKKRKANPIIKGSVHAWIGIVCGALFSLLWGAVIVLMIIGLAFAP